MDTLDELIFILTEPEVDIPDGTLEKVAALLRAGARMRQAEYGHYITMAKNAWDAALDEVGSDKNDAASTNQDKD